MTIDAVFEVSCDGCGQASIEDVFDTKAGVWGYLKQRGWKRRKQFTWCGKCVEEGRFARNFVEWAQVAKEDR